MSFLKKATAGHLRELFLRIITVNLEMQKIVGGLPALDIREGS